MSKLFWTAFLVILLTANLFAQSKTFFQTIEGSWKGTLEYQDYTSNKRVTMNVLITFKPVADGNSAETFAIYDDFGKIYKSNGKERIELAAKKFFEDETEFKIESNENGKMILIGSGQDGNDIQPTRKTITWTNDTLTILKETRTPWSFRNVYSLQRVAENNWKERFLNVEHLKADFAVMKKALTELHAGLYRYNTPTEMNAKFDALEAKLNKPLAESEFFKLVSQMLSEIKCYHTYTNPYNQKKEIREGLFNQSNYFPFYFEIIDRKMFITENASSKKLSRGSEITKINGVTVQEIIKKLLATTFADGNGTVEHRLKMLELNRSNGVLYANFDWMFPLHFPVKDGTFKIEAIDFITKKPTNFEVLAMTKAERLLEMEKRYGKNPSYDDDWKFEIWNDGTAYLKVANFITWRLSFDFKKFFADAFAEMRAKNAKNLVIDIRGNGGGDDNAYRELFKYMSKKEFPCKPPTKRYIRTNKADTEILKYVDTYDDDISNALKNGVPENLYKQTENGLLEFNDGQTCEPLKPYVNNFQGKIYLLINSDNASAAYIFSRYTKDAKLATLIGQETGGNLKGFNGGTYLFVTLPNSKFEFDIPVFAIFSDGENEDSGVMPDVSVERKAEDIGNNFDREIDSAKKIIKADKP